MGRMRVSERFAASLSAYKLPARMRVAAATCVSLPVCVCAAALCVVLTQPSERALRIRHVFRDGYCGFACANEVSAALR